MSNQKVGYLLLIPSIILGLILFNVNSRAALSAASHVVISEIMLGESGTGGGDREFIELYNPTGETVDLSGWRVTRKTEAGTTQNNLIASMSGTIKPHGYFLIGSPEYAASNSADLPYGTSTHIAANNTVLLYSDAGTTIVDKVGLGNASDNEATSAANPSAGQSVERKATAQSTALSMMIGGLDELLGNGEDSDNNGNDFVIRQLPQPQTAVSAIEPDMSTPTASATATASASSTPTASTSASPSASVSATPSPTASPSATASATPSMSPTASPTITPSPSASASATPAPTASPSATPRVFVNINLGDRSRICTITYQTRKILFLTIRIPNIECFTINN